MEEGCKGCYYNTSTECLILKERQENCSSRADKEEAQRREEAIKQYKSITSGNCEPVREILQKHFMKLYLSGYNDMEIEKILKVSASSVGDYRRGLGLEIQSKRKKEPAATGK